MGGAAEAAAAEDAAAEVAAAVMLERRAAILLSACFLFSATMITAITMRTISAATVPPIAPPMTAAFEPLSLLDAAAGGTEAPGCATEFTPRVTPARGPVGSV